MLAFTDQSYLHNTHAAAHSYLARDGDDRVEHSASTGNWLIIMHTIAINGPCYEYDENDLPMMILCGTMIFLT